MRVSIVLACMLVLLASCSRQARIITVPMPVRPSLPIEKEATKPIGIEHTFAPDVKTTLVASDATLRVELASAHLISPTNPQECLVVCVWTLAKPYHSLEITLVDARETPPQVRSAVLRGSDGVRLEDVKDRVSFSAETQAAKQAFRTWWATIDIPWSLLFSSGHPDAAVQVEVYPVRAQRSNDILRLQPQERR